MIGHYLNTLIALFPHASGLKLNGDSKLPIGVKVSVCLRVCLCQPSDELACTPPGISENTSKTAHFA